MSEVSGPSGGADGRRPASEVFGIEMVDPPRPRRWSRAVAAVAAAVLADGAAPLNVGGRRITIVERGSERVLAAWPEQYGDDAQVLRNRIADDLATLDADGFAERWITGSAPIS